MDAEFIQSVARVGEAVELSLLAGGRIEGVLTELTLTRLVLRTADGRAVAVALPSIATVGQVPQSKPLPVGEPSLPPIHLAVAPQGQIPSPGVTVDLPTSPGMSTSSDITSTQVMRLQQPPLPHAVKPSQVDTRSVEKALESVSRLPIIPVDTDIYVVPADRSRLRQIRDSYDYAARIDELHPRFGRLGPLYHRTLMLWNGDQQNAELTRLVGAFALLKPDLETARRRFAQAVEAGDLPALRLLAIAAAQAADADTAVYGLLKYFSTVKPAADTPSWQALLALLDARQERGALGEILNSQSHDEAVQQTVLHELDGATASQAPMKRPAGAAPTPRAPLLYLQIPSQTPTTPRRQPIRHSGTKRSPGSGRQSSMRGQDPYQTAKYLEHQIKDLPGAQRAYREAIAKNIKRESAVKDLAWLTKRVDGSEAALRVIEEEFPDDIRPGNALDNILIDFLTGARRYSEALAVLQRQHGRRDITTGRRYHLAHQIAAVKLATGEDATEDWRAILDQSPDNPAAQRGLAMALIQRGTAEALDEAERLIEHHTDDQATGIRAQITTRRQGGELDSASTELLEKLLLADVPGVDSASPLVTYVMQNFSDLAARAKDQNQQERQLPSRDLVNVTAEMGRQMAGKQPEGSASAYISAAVLARELGEDNVQRYLHSGLTMLGEVVLGRQAHESARDLYCAALAAADEREDTDNIVEIHDALTGYLRLLSGRPAAVRRHRDRIPLAKRPADGVAKVLYEEYTKHGDELFNLIPPLLADTSMARDLVLDAICSKSELLTAAAAHLGRLGSPQPRADAQSVRGGWQHAVEQWNRERRRLTHGLQELQHLEMSENVLESALNRLGEYEGQTSKPLQEAFGRIKEALGELRRYISEQSYEGRASCLRLAGSAAKALRADVKSAPTSLAVELVEPVAVSIQELVAQTQTALDVSQAPQPELSLALDKFSASQDGVVTVQVKVANESWRAPLDSPEIAVVDDPELFSVEGSTIRLPNSVAGGTSRIQPVKLRVTKLALNNGAFSMPVALKYRSRSSNEFLRFDATLPVRLAREEEFEEIQPNPFQDGASGRPVENKKMFYGRDDLIDRISKRLGQASSPGIGVAIFGQKRAGKSSLRLHLTQRLRESGMPVVDIGNIGDLSPESGDLTGTRLLALLMWRILEGADRAMVAIGAPPVIPQGLTRADFLKSPEPVHDCANIVEEHRAVLSMPVKTMTVLIDEFQYIDQWIRKGLLSTSFMQAFKALIERRLFHLVIVGQAALDRLIKADPNVFGVFVAERVTYLKDHDARRLIEEPILMPARASRYREGAVDQVLELTGGSAFYIQRFCNQLVEYMNSERAPVVTEADVEQVREAFLGTLEAKDFDGLESSGYTETDAATSEEYRDVLLAVARASRNQLATMAAIRDEYQGPRLYELLDDLVMRDVVRRESGAYRIVVRMYSDWLLKNFGVASGAHAT